MRPLVVKIVQVREEGPGKNCDVRPRRDQAAVGSSGDPWLGLILKDRCLLQGRNLCIDQGEIKPGNLADYSFRGGLLPHRGGRAVAMAAGRFLSRLGLSWTEPDLERRKSINIYQQQLTNCTMRVILPPGERELLPGLGRVPLVISGHSGGRMLSNDPAAFEAEMVEVERVELQHQVHPPRTHRRGDQHEETKVEPVREKPYLKVSPSWHTSMPC